MSLLHVVKCNACGKIHELGPMFDARGLDPRHWAPALPDEWYSLAKGNAQTQEPQDFCSAECVGRYLQAPVQPAEAPQEQPECKARRFLLVDGQTADITEGVKWTSGWVSLDPAGELGFKIYDSWEHFKEAYPGSGVQWIDRPEKHTGGVIPLGTIAIVGEA